MLVLVQCSGSAQCTVAAVQWWQCLCSYTVQCSGRVSVRGFPGSVGSDFVAASFEILLQDHLLRLLHHLLEILLQDHLLRHHLAILLLHHLLHLEILLQDHLVLHHLLKILLLDYLLRHHLANGDPDMQKAADISVLFFPRRC